MAQRAKDSPKAGPSTMRRLRAEAFSWFALHLQSLTVHPAFWLDSREPVLSRWDSSQILRDVLFPDVAHRNLLPFAVDDGNAKDSFTQENTFRVMTQPSMAEVSEECLRLIEPIMNRQVIFGLPAKSLCATLCMLQRMRHGQNSFVS